MKIINIIKRFIFGLFKKKKKIVTNVKLGWKKDNYDPRDFKFKISVPHELPSMVDLRNMCPPVYNQGGVGSCTANALGAAFQFEQIKQKKQDFIPSRLFIYYNERAMEGTVNEDSGAMIRDGIKTMVKEGVCPETMWEYIENRFRTKPGDECYKVALDNQILEYMRINPSLYEIKHCLSEGYPIVFGFMIYDHFMSEEVARTGIAKMPKSYERCIGGHAVCCFPETTIITNNGIKNIEDIEVGDYVLTHVGNFKKVLNVFERDVNEKIIKIKNNYNEDLFLTKEHPVFTKKYSRLTKLNQLKDSGFLLNDIKCVNASDLVEGNLLYSPIYDKEEIYDNIIYDKDFFELLGMYIGDGNINIRYSKNGNVKSMKLRFSLGKKYPELINRCKELLEKYSKNKVSEYWYENYVIVTCYDTDLAKKIGDLCGFANNKTINWKILVSPIEIQKSFIRGWYETDGCDINNGFLITTAEKQLMNEMCFILKRLKLIYSITKNDAKISIIKSKKCKIKAQYNIHINNVDVITMTQNRTKHRGIYFNNYLINRLTSTPKNIDYVGKVYNIEVEDDNSYTANGIAVHNCAVGFDDSKEMLIVRNSWSDSWGDKGYFYLPYGYITTPGLSDDFWTIRLVE